MCSYTSRIASGGLPYITIKYAQTLDGRIATSDGQSQWISSDADLTYAHELRAANDAVMVGIGTVMTDNPRLTVRLAPGRNPLRIVVDSLLRTPLSSHVLSDEHVSKTILAVTPQATPARIAEVQRRGARVIVVDPTPEGLVDLNSLLQRLRTEGVRSVMVEGGAKIITSLLRSGLANRLIICIAPKVVGSGIEGVGDLGIAALPEAIKFTSHSFRQLGEDVMFDGEIAPAGVLSRS
jgi:riboflavin-specific deaminase-like protein